MVKSNGKIQENRITVLGKPLDEDDAKSLQKLLDKATDIILEESEEHEFTILQVEVSLSLFKKPYVYIWLKKLESLQKTWMMHLRRRILT